MRKLAAFFLTILVWSLSTPVLGSHCQFHSADSIAVGLNLNPSLPVVYDLSGRFAEQFMTKYNGSYPYTSWVADRVLIFSRPNDNRAILALYHEDCLFLQTAFDLRFLETLLPKPFAPTRETSDGHE